MKSLFVLTCLVAVCFVATNAASVDTALRNLLEALEKRHGHGPPRPKPCSVDSDCVAHATAHCQPDCPLGKCDVAVGETVGVCGPPPKGGEAKKCDAALNENDACNVTSGDTGTDGKCKGPPGVDFTKLYCVNGPPRKDSPPQKVCTSTTEYSDCDLTSGAAGSGGKCRDPSSLPLHCVPVCSSNSDCPADHVCDVAEERCKKSCTDDADCDGRKGHVCTNNICEKPAAKRSLMDDLKEMVKKWQ